MSQIGLSPQVGMNIKDLRVATTQCIYHMGLRISNANHMELGVFPVDASIFATATTRSERCFL